MSKFPTLSGKDVVDILKKLGFEVKRQKGSHVFLQHMDGRATVVPVHAGENIGPGLFAKILRDTELTRKDFLR
jgi:predicted RNA binding protein YcfA (HicA-like mRNA interferase family)